jgi:hypothetical protein
VNFQAPASHVVGVLVLHQYQPIAPALGKDRGGLVHTVGVVAKGAMKRRIFADTSVDQVAAGRIAAGKDVRLVRDEQLRRRIGKLAKDCLAPNYHQVLRVRNDSRGANDVLQLCARHFFMMANWS